LSKINEHRPKFSENRALQIAKEYFAVIGDIKPLPSERDLNYLLKAPNKESFVLKIAASSENKENLLFQNSVMNYLKNKINCPEVLLSKEKEPITVIKDKNGIEHFIRLLTYIPGQMWGDIKTPSIDLYYDLGRFIAKLTHSLEEFFHPSAKRDFHWDLKNSPSVIGKFLEYQQDKNKITIINYFLNQYNTQVVPNLSKLKKSVIHNDANDYNLVVNQSQLGLDKIGIIDFGDLVYSYTIFELAIAIAYAILGKEDLLYLASIIVKGYNTVIPLREDELDILFILICMRLTLSVAISGYQKNLEPNNKYLTISEQLAWETLFNFRKINPNYASYVFKHACGISPIKNETTPSKLTKLEILKKREKLIGKNLSISYKEPLKIVKGFMQYLYDEEGKTYLDMRNNVPHVGHSHPKIVWALQKQAAILNTNTRYLQEELVNYAERLCSTLPDKFQVCYFVNSGSEANELALRLARTHTNRKDIVAMEGAYHGNTGELINISHYKFSGKGGKGAPQYVHTIKIPDIYRGAYQVSDPEAGKKYAEDVKNVIRGKQVAAFIFESIMGSTGQIIYPKDYLHRVFKSIHENGGVCIADEVQVGFGRVGKHFWAFELYNIIPDIITLGKPIGNGHPIGAVVTTRELAESFNNGMEFFSTTGGNTVSCVVGMAVLDIIEAEKLQENALKVGNYIIEELEQIKEKYSIIGDVRGSGLFLGVDLIKDVKTLEPAEKEAEKIVEKMKNHGILIGNDKNVLKIKPPICITLGNAKFFVKKFEDVLVKISSEWS